MSDGRNVIYCYDGTFDGLMCCVFDSYIRREIPSEIVSDMPEQLSFCEIHFVETVPENSARVTAAIPKKISPNAFDMIKKAFLSCENDKDLLILIFIHKGFKHGGKIEAMLTDDTVNRLNKIMLFCTREAHLLLGFLRFSDYGGYLAAVIEPKNKAIPLIADHFTDRMRNENFLIYDKTHRMALIYYNYKAEIAENIDFELPDASAEEEMYRELWKGFYKTIGIEERYNPRCRMNMMPKRYWTNMTEMRGELGIDDISRNRISGAN